VVFDVALIGLLFAAVPVQRIGSGRDRRRTPTPKRFVSLRQNI